MTTGNRLHPPSPDRSGKEELHDEYLTIHNATFVSVLMDAMPDIAMVLNEHRQIVGVNKRLMDTFGVSDSGFFIGKRPGEALGCIHCMDGPDGCGTSPHCSVCGAVITIFACQQTGQQTIGECRIALQKDGGSALDLEALATPLQVGGKDFTIFAMKDISADKWKQVIEKIFFHDIINTAGGIRGLAEILVDSDSLTQEREDEYKGWMLMLSDNLIEEIQHNRRLLAAERGEYDPSLEQTDLARLLQEVYALYKNHQRAPGRTVLLADAASCMLWTDTAVVRRIVGNMLLNAMEAVPKGETVRLSSHLLSDRVRIEVSNPGMIAPDVQLKIFKRSFSTKGTTGRGIGTYSMKLFGERYLGGTVGFVCENGQTTFYIELLLSPSAPRPSTAVS